MKPSPLNNTRYKIQKDKALTVGFFGGSVTVGTGASNQGSTSWRALTRDWLKSTFRKATITEVNASCGNAGSVFGVYRVDAHYIGDRAPDLNFIELAVNDSIDLVNGRCVYDIDENNVYIETIVRKIYASNPSADIVFVLTGNYERLKRESDGEETFGQTYINIGNYYEIPVIRVGSEIAKLLSETNGGTFPEKENNSYPASWYQYYIDNVHPSDAGHQVYAQTVIGYLRENLLSNRAVPLKTKQLPTKTYCETNGYGELMMDACIISPKQLKEGLGSGGFSVNPNDHSLMPYSLISQTDGDEIVLTFNARSLALWIMAPKLADQTAIRFSIDGGTEQVLDIYYSTNWENNKVFQLAENLSEGIHTIRIKHIGNSTLDIRYFLLSGISGTQPSVSIAG